MGSLPDNLDGTRNPFACVQNPVRYECRFGKVFKERTEGFIVRFVQEVEAFR